MVFISFQKFQGGVIQPESMSYTWSLGKDTVGTLYTHHHQQQQQTQPQPSHGNGAMRAPVQAS